VIEFLPVYVVSGVFAGIVAAMFGVGGGFAVAPILLTLLTFQAIGGENVMHLTVGTTQAVIFVTASYSAVLRWRAGDTNPRLVLKFLPLVAIGAILGSTFGGALPGLLLKIIFVFFIALTIARGLLSKRIEEVRSGSDLTGVGGIEYWTSGSLAGFLGALMGPGPAVLVAPFLRRLRFSMATTVATCSTLAATLGLFAGGGYVVGGLAEPGLPDWSLGYIYLPAFVGLAAGGLAGAPLGLRISRRLDDHLQGRLYLVYLFVVLLVMLWNMRDTLGLGG
jgi:uncharacterized membrane protein YfcA